MVAPKLRNDARWLRKLTIVCFVAFCIIFALSSLYSLSLVGYHPVPTRPQWPQGIRAAVPPQPIDPMGENRNSRWHGWHSIHVFYGASDLLEVPQSSKWYSQARQDEIIAALFRNQPNLYFIDLAANDAVDLSNTLGLERNLNWTGLCIEANPQYWRGLSFRDCQVIAAVVGKKRMEKVKFHLDRKEFGGIVGRDFDNKRRRKATYTEFYTVTLAEILRDSGSPNVIDYMSLDVEGAEQYIMEEFPWNDFRIKVLTVERPKEALQKILVTQGYRGVALVATFGETLWAHESILKSLDLASLTQFKLPLVFEKGHFTVETAFIDGAYHP